MFIKTTEKVERVEEITLGVRCDVCGKEFLKDNPEQTFEYQEVMILDTFCGYDSVFGDGSRIQLDVCQHCLKELLGKFIRIVNQGGEE